MVDKYDVLKFMSNRIDGQINELEDMIMLSRDDIVEAYYRGRCAEAKHIKELFLNAIKNKPKDKNG